MERRLCARYVQHTEYLKIELFIAFHAMQGYLLIADSPQTGMLIVKLSKVVFKHLIKLNLIKGKMGFSFCLQHLCWVEFIWETQILPFFPN